MRQAESSRDTVQRRKISCLRDAFVFFLWHVTGYLFRGRYICVLGTSIHHVSEHCGKGFQGHGFKGQGHRVEIW